jgi:excisionase family DNA binding protein
VTDPADHPSYSTAEVARRLGVSTPTVQRWVDAGHLKAWKTVGGHRRIDALSAERLFAASEGATPRPAPAGATISVLVVDDNPDDRDILGALVETALPDASITLAANGFQGLVTIGRNAPDIVITDLAMPHMNGVEMIRELQHCSVRPGAIIAVSSKTREQIARLGSLPDDVGFIAKPIDHFVLIAALQAAAQRIAERSLDSFQTG